MRPRKIVSPEVIAVLDARLPHEITDEIIIYLVRTPLAVTSVYKKHIREIEWCEGMQNAEWEIDMRFIRYTCNIERYMTLCKECGRIGETDFWTLFPDREEQSGIEHCVHWDLNPKGGHPCQSRAVYSYCEEGTKPRYLLPRISEKGFILYKRDFDDVKKIIDMWGLALY